MSVVGRLDGRAGSLLDWPFGRECRITFDRPLNPEELRELEVLNSLSGRHWVGVAFDCEIDTAQLQAAHEALSDCVVFAVDQDTGETVWPGNNAQSAEFGILAESP